MEYQSIFDKLVPARRVFATLNLASCIIWWRVQFGAHQNLMCVHLNWGFKWLIFVNKRALFRLPNYQCHMHASFLSRTNIWLFRLLVLFARGTCKYIKHTHLDHLKYTLNKQQKIMDYFLFFFNSNLSKNFDWVICDKV